MRHTLDQAHKNEIGGDWAGNVYQKSGCPATCVGNTMTLPCVQNTLSSLALTDYVNKNPAAFEKAYFDFRSLRIYKPLSSASYTPSHPKHRLYNH
jgi:hypothetical protein